MGGGIAFFPGSLKDIDSVTAEVARDMVVSNLLCKRLG
jgi:hypothetical protein